MQNWIYYFFCDTSSPPETENKLGLGKENFPCIWYANCLACYKFDVNADFLAW
jgi:hypothetical protein